MHKIFNIFIIINLSSATSQMESNLFDIFSMLELCSQKSLSSQTVNDSVELMEYDDMSSNTNHSDINNSSCQNIISSWLSSMDIIQETVEESNQEETKHQTEPERIPSSETFSSDASQDFRTQKSECSSSEEKLNRNQRKHLNRERRKRGQKNRLMQLSNGYYTKNFLPIAKNAHIMWIEKQMGVTFFLHNEELQAIREKNGIVLDDYIFMYSLAELKPVWNLFFAKKVLYRDVMTSRALAKNRLIFIRFIHRFEEAFKTGVFDHIA